MAHKAVRAGYRLEEIRKMTPRQLVAVIELEADSEREMIKNGALMHRIAQADMRGWKKAMAELAADNREPVQDMITSMGEAADPEKIEGNPLFTTPEE